MYKISKVKFLIDQTGRNKIRTRVPNIVACRCVIRKR